METQGRKPKPEKIVSYEVAPPNDHNYGCIYALDSKGVLWHSPLVLNDGIYRHRQWYPLNLPD